MIDALPDLIATLPAYLGGHMRLSVAALLAALAISLPLGILAARNPGVARPALGVASVMQTIPALALLALMVPLLGGMIGFAPAFFALTLYGVLPVLRNTIVGLQGVDPVVREAARGVGMSTRQSLLRVELPLAAPTIIAGIRTATVWVVGAATLATPVGATSLGNYIFSGLQTRTWAAVIFGCLCSAGLALLLDQLIAACERAMQSGRRRGALISALVVILAPVLVLGGAVMVNRASGEGSVGRQTQVDAGFDDGPVIIGAKSFTEQYILAEVIERRLEGAGARTERRENLGSTVVFDALRSGEIDVYVDYTGTLWANVMGEEAPIPRHQMYAAVSSWLYENAGIVALGRLGFENAYGFAVTADFAESEAVTSIADLVALPSLSVGADPEFFARTEWERTRAFYGLSGIEQRSMDSAFMYDAVRNGAVDVITAYTSDGRVLAYDLVILDDPRGALPPYDAVILLSAEAAQKPAVGRALAPLIGAIDADLMREANAVVEVERRSVSEAAQLILDAVEP
ncbi:Substrate-binding region and inner membrane component of ABC-typeglycine betaine transport system [Oceanicaulis alexandrii HTCC2633]|uniref:glycine betaine ABC transporter substrate-binding protein n=1 Tax=Oceanicaulis sp. HTCC2633 TaxID=314254 RepID=UPI000066AB37|nr:glycine betaine ABC transporter substrate-binding protein [Oceanicaulis sp. HTCC2633]EAP88874.1 Substrate-binding region and inner membrane component of ABC-typeglycine betaine transport system [Oceanicaulis alexandrii HTCC2633] [Oceanicaulis sp. HTCC2633]